MADDEEIEKAIEMFFAAATTFRNIGLGVESAILFAPEDEQRFTVQQAVKIIERYDMKIVGFVLEEKSDGRAACIVYDGKSRWMSHENLLTFINRWEEDDAET